MKTLTLSRQYAVGSTVFSSLSFREPKLADYRQLGRVIELQRGLAVTYPEALWGYADRLLQDIPPGVLGELDLEDAFKVEEAMLGFFSEARQRLRARENSSSGSSGAPATSTA